MRVILMSFYVDIDGSPRIRTGLALAAILALDAKIPGPIRANRCSEGTTTPQSIKARGPRADVEESRGEWR